MEKVIAIMLGLAALAAQGQGLPQDFTEGAYTRSEPVIEDGFIGIEWLCYSEADVSAGEQDLTPSQLAAEMGTSIEDLDVETCYAGYAISDIDGIEPYEDAWLPVTGP